MLARLLVHMRAVRDHWPTIVYLKEALMRDDSLMFMEAWLDFGCGDDREKLHAIHQALYVAPTKGGIWTTAERAKMREWGA